MAARLPTDLGSEGGRMPYRLALVVATLLAGTRPGLAQTHWDIDPAHTTVQFSVRHLMISNVRGEFRNVGGSVRAPDADLARSTVEATIDASSIDTREARRDEHLRSPDFLDVARYPTITFKSKKIESAGDRRWKVTGDLTLHGVTREVVLDVEGPTAEVKDMQGKLRAGAHATAEIDRRDFDIVWNKPLEAGGLTVGNAVAISIDVEGIKATPSGG
jgi:polyisoprenoid-binding protein YceI